MTHVQLTSTVLQVALSTGVVLAFLTLALVLKRPTARLWAQYWVVWFVANLLFVLVATERSRGVPPHGWTGVLVAVGAVAQFAAQVFLVRAVSAHASPPASWARYRHLVFAVMSLQFLTPFVSMLAPAPTALDLAQLVFRLAALAPYLFCLAMVVRAKGRMDRMARRFALLSFSVGTLRNAGLAFVQLMTLSATAHLQLPSAWGAIVLALQLMSTFSMCLASLYLLLVDERDAARRLVAAQIGDRRLVSLGRMSNAVARDLDRVLQDARAGADMLRGATTAPDIDAGVDRITSAVARGKDRGAALLAYARDVQPHIERVVLHAWVAETCRTIADSWPDPSRLAIKAEDTSLAVMMDPALTRRTLAEVIANARESGGSGRVLVTVHEYPTRQRGIIRVTDDGTGIASQVVAQATDPFFTTKGDDRAGLGLALGDSFARQQGGRLVLLRNHPRGTIVEIELPLATR